MSNLRISNLFESSTCTYQESQPCCCNSNALKISLVVFGLLLIGGAIASHIGQVNAVAVYTMGGVGGVLILATIIGSLIHCFLQRYSQHIDKNNFTCAAAPWNWDDEEPHPLPKGWTKHQAEQTIIVQYGEGVTIPKGDTYFAYNGKIAIGFHGSYNPPSGMESVITMGFM